MYNTYLNNIDFRVGIYIRLSQEDKDKKYESDSESVINQKELLRGYVKNNNFNLVKEYVDDGYSGTDFDRPAFKEMLEDIKNKKINCVIVKDLSRFGRDHVMTGYYTETFFPENNIRFISISESVDTFKEQASNDSSTFIIACNDYYSKQNSVKIRAVLNQKRLNGKFVGSLPSFGYMRDPEDKGHLIPNPETDWVVKEIFKLRTNGVGPTEIANKLNEMKVPTPSGYKKTSYSSQLIDRDTWNITTVKKILSNRIYTGDMVQHVQTKVNYKSKKKITLDEKLWTIVENTHEALVDKETFNYVNILRKRKTRNYEIKTKREKRLLEGNLFCKECGNRLTVLYRRNQDYWSINCNRYSRDPVRGRCYSHFFPYNYLEKQILDKFNEVVSKLINGLDLEELNNEITRNIHKEKENIDEVIKSLKVEKEKITNKITMLYNDRCDGVISTNVYKELASPFELKLKQIVEKIDEEELKKYTSRNNQSILPNYIKKIKELLDLNKPKRELIEALIDKIIIDKDRNITIKFKYDVIPQIEFIYVEENKVRNPYGRIGKKKD